MSDSDKLEKFHFGITENFRLYGSAEPPSYNLSRIEMPVYLYYGKADTLHNQTVRIQMTALR